MFPWLPFCSPFSSRGHRNQRSSSTTPAKRRHSHLLAGGGEYGEKSAKPRLIVTAIQPYTVSTASIDSRRQKGKSTLKVRYVTPARGGEVEEKKRKGAKDDPTMNPAVHNGMVPATPSVSNSFISGVGKSFTDATSTRDMREEKGRGSLAMADGAETHKLKDISNEEHRTPSVLKSTNDVRGPNDDSAAEMEGYGRNGMKTDGQGESSMASILPCKTGKEREIGRSGAVRDMPTTAQGPNIPSAMGSPPNGGMGNGTVLATPVDKRRLEAGVSNLADAACKTLMTEPLPQSTTNIHASTLVNGTLRDATLGWSHDAGAGDSEGPTELNSKLVSKSAPGLILASHSLASSIAETIVSAATAGASPATTIRLLASISQSSNREDHHSNGTTPSSSELYGNGAFDGKRAPCYSGTKTGGKVGGSDPLRKPLIAEEEPNSTSHTAPPPSIPHGQDDLDMDNETSLSHMQERELKIPGVKPESLPPTTCKPRASLNSPAHPVEPSPMSMAEMETIASENIGVLQKNASALVASPTGGDISFKAFEKLPTPSHTSPTRPGRGVEEPKEESAVPNMETISAGEAESEPWLEASVATSPDPSLNPRSVMVARGRGEKVKEEGRQIGMSLEKKGNAGADINTVSCDTDEKVKGDETTKLTRTRSLKPDGEELNGSTITANTRHDAGVKDESDGPCTMVSAHSIQPLSNSNSFELPGELDEGVDNEHHQTTPCWDKNADEAQAESTFTRAGESGQIYDTSLGATRTLTCPSEEECVLLATGVVNPSQEGTAEDNLVAGTEQEPYVAFPLDSPFSPDPHSLPKKLIEATSNNDHQTDLNKGAVTTALMDGVLELDESSALKQSSDHVNEQGIIDGRYGPTSSPNAEIHREETELEPWPTPSMASSLNSSFNPHSFEASMVTEEPEMSPETVNEAMTSPQTPPPHQGRGVAEAEFEAESGSEAKISREKAKYESGEAEMEPWPASSMASSLNSSFNPHSFEPSMPLEQPEYDQDEAQTPHEEPEAPPRTPTEAKKTHQPPQPEQGSAEADFGSIMGRETEHWPTSSMPSSLNSSFNPHSFVPSMPLEEPELPQARPTLPEISPLTILTDSKSSPTTSDEGNKTDRSGAKTSSSSESANQKGFSPRGKGQAASKSTYSQSQTPSPRGVSSVATSNSPRSKPSPVASNSDSGRGREESPLAGRKMSPTTARTMASAVENTPTPPVKRAARARQQTFGTSSAMRELFGGVDGPATEKENGRKPVKRPTRGEEEEPKATAAASEKEAKATETGGEDIKLLLETVTKTEVEPNTTEAPLPAKHETNAPPSAPAYTDSPSNYVAASIPISLTTPSEAIHAPSQPVQREVRSKGRAFATSSAMLELFGGADSATSKAGLPNYGGKPPIPVATVAPMQASTTMGDGGESGAERWDGGEGGIRSPADEAETMAVPTPDSALAQPLSNEAEMAGNEPCGGGPRRDTPSCEEDQASTGGTTTGKDRGGKAEEWEDWKKVKKAAGLDVGAPLMDVKREVVVNKATIDHGEKRTQLAGGRRSSSIRQQVSALFGVSETKRAAPTTPKRSQPIGIASLKTAGKVTVNTRQPPLPSNGITRGGGMGGGGGGGGFSGGGGGGGPPPINPITSSNGQGGAKNDPPAPNGGSLLIRGARCVNDDSMFEADVLVKDGVITAIGPSPMQLEGVGAKNDTPDEVIEANGAWLLPGGIDVIGWEDSTSSILSPAMLMKASLAGGTTTLIVSSQTKQSGENLITAFDRFQAQWESTNPTVPCNFSISHTIRHWAGERTQAEMSQLVHSHGVNSFLLELGEGSTGRLMDAMEHSRAVGAHCRIAIGQEGAGDLERRLSRTSSRNDLLGRLQAAEISKLCVMARAANCPIGIQPSTYQLSTTVAAAIHQCQAEGSPLHVELPFQALASSHDPSQSDQTVKLLAVSPLAMCVSGGDAGDKDASWLLEAVEWRMAQVWERTVVSGNGSQAVAEEGLMDPMRLVAVCSTNAAKVFNIYPKKGRIAVGSDADLALWPSTPSPQGHLRPVLTIHAGRVVYRDGRHAPPMARVTGAATATSHFLPLPAHSPHLFASSSGSAQELAGAFVQPLASTSIILTGPSEPPRREGPLAGQQPLPSAARRDSATSGASSTSGYADSTRTSGGGGIGEGPSLTGRPGASSLSGGRMGRDPNAQSTTTETKSRSATKVIHPPGGKSHGPLW